MADTPDHYSLAADTLDEALRLTIEAADPGDGSTSNAYAIVRSESARLRDDPGALPGMAGATNNGAAHYAAGTIVAGAVLMHFRVTREVLTPLLVLYGRLFGKTWNDDFGAISYRLGIEPANPVLPDTVSSTLSLPPGFSDDAIAEAFRTFIDAHALAEHVCRSSHADESDPTARTGVDAAVGALATIRREARAEYSAHLGTLAQAGSPYDTVRVAGLRDIRSAQVSLGALLERDADADADNDVWQAITQGLQTGTSPVPDIEPDRQRVLISGMSTIMVGPQLRLWAAGPPSPIQITSHELLLHCLMVTHMLACGRRVPGALAAPPFPDLQALHMLEVCASLTGLDTRVARSTLQQASHYATDAIVGVSAFEPPERRDALHFVARSMARRAWRLGRGLALMRDLNRLTAHS